MGKEKIEKMPTPGQKLSEKRTKEIIEKFGLKYNEADKEAGRDLEYFVVVTKDRREEPGKERKEVRHYIHKWEKLPDQELGLIPVGEVIKALQKYYPDIDPEEKCPVREAVKRLRKAGKDKN